MAAYYNNFIKNGNIASYSLFGESPTLDTGLTLKIKSLGSPPQNMPFFMTISPPICDRFQNPSSQSKNNKSKCITFNLI